MHVATPLHYQLVQTTSPSFQIRRTSRPVKIIQEFRWAQTRDSSPAQNVFTTGRVVPGKKNLHNEDRMFVTK